MYLYLTLFWLIAGVLVQVFWTTLAPLAHIPIDRFSMGAIFLVLFSINFIRWWLSRRPVEAPAQERPRTPRALEYDPNLDFSKLEDPKPSDEKKDPPAS